MSNGVGLLATFIYFIFVIIILLVWRKKKIFLKLINLFKTPDNTTVVSNWIYNITPTIFILSIFTVVGINSLLRDHADIALVLLSLIAYQAPKTSYNYFVLRIKGVQKDDLCLLPNHQEFQNLIQKEKTEIEFVSIFILFISYVVLLVSLEKYVDIIESPLSFFIILVIFVVISMLLTIALKLSLYKFRRYKKKRNY